MAESLLFGGACFTGDMQVLTRRGWVRWDNLTTQDEVASRDESHPDSPVEFKRVEKIFHTTGPVYQVRVAGEVIRTTGQHPFWVRGKGWVEASSLQAGDLLATHDGQWVAVDEVTEGGAAEKLYNCRVADYHTYFVGCEEWGFSVWAHNDCHANSYSSTRTNTLYALYDKAGQFLKWGISSNPARRYTKKFLSKINANRVDLLTGSRRSMANIERALTTQHPGPMNLEDWAGAIQRGVP